MMEVIRSYEALLHIQHALCPRRHNCRCENPKSLFAAVYAVASRCCTADAVSHISHVALNYFRDLKVSGRILKRIQ
jgi:hypothetical protein